MITNQYEMNEMSLPFASANHSAGELASLVDTVRIYLVKCGMTHSEAQSMAANIIQATELDNGSGADSRKRSAIDAAISTLQMQTAEMLDVPPAVPVARLIRMRKTEPFRALSIKRLSRWFRMSIRYPVFARANH